MLESFPGPYYTNHYTNAAIWGPNGKIVNGRRKEGVSPDGLKTAKPSVLLHLRILPLQALIEAFTVS